MFSFNRKYLSKPASKLTEIWILLFKKLLDPVDIAFVPGFSATCNLNNPTWNIYKFNLPTSIPGWKPRRRAVSLTNFKILSVSDIVASVCDSKKAQSTCSHWRPLGWLSKKPIFSEMSSATKKRNGRRMGIQICWRKYEME